MAWINTGRNGWFEDWFRRYSETIEISDENRTGDHWRETVFGDEIVLVPDGGGKVTGHGEPSPSRYRAFRYVAALDQVIEAQHLLRDTSHRGEFNPALTAATLYYGVRAECVNAITDKLEAEIAPH